MATIQAPSALVYLYIEELELGEGGIWRKSEGLSKDNIYTLNFEKIPPSIMHDSSIIRDKDDSAKSTYSARSGGRNFFFPCILYLGIGEEGGVL